MQGILYQFNEINVHISAGKSCLAGPCIQSELTLRVVIGADHCPSLKIEAPASTAGSTRSVSLGVTAKRTTHMNVPASKDSLQEFLHIEQGNLS